MAFLCGFSEQLLAVRFIYLLNILYYVLSEIFMSSAKNISAQNKFFVSSKTSSSFYQVL